MSREDLSLGERVHLASKDLRGILKPSIWAALAGLALIGLALTWTYNTTNVLEEYGYHENHLNAPDGPLCDPLEPVVSIDSNPAMIVLNKGFGAEKAGLQNGDTIIRINDVEIPDAATLENWNSFLPEVKAGDVVEVIVLRNNEQISYMVEILADESQDGRPIIGVLIPYSCDSYFFLDEEEKSLTLDAIRLIDYNLSSIYQLNIVFGVIFGYFLISTLWKGRKLRDEIDDWEDAYLDQHYILTFETNKPQGKSNGEKIFNMTQAVFPELRKKNGKPEKWRGTIEGKDDYVFDCYQETNEKEPRYFIAKHFGKEKIDLEKVQEFCDMVIEGTTAETMKEKFKKWSSAKEAFRVIVVGENYDEKFLKDRTRQKLMNELKFDKPVDLILEVDGNYQVLWVES